MAIEVKVGPSHLAIHRGHTVLLTEVDGQIRCPSPKGLFFYDTRLMSEWVAYSDGEPWELLNGGTTSPRNVEVFLVNGEFTTQDGRVRGRTLSLSINRYIDGGIHEDLDLTNHGTDDIHFNLEILIQCDFADIFEVKAGHNVRRGRIETEWSADKQRLSTSYTNLDFHRALIVTASRGGSKAVYANGRLSFRIDLKRHATWHCCLGYELVDGANRFRAPRECGRSEACRRRERRIVRAREKMLKLDTNNHSFNELFSQAVHDVFALELSVDACGRSQIVSAAGLPWFVALFGRDNLVTSLERMPVCPEFATRVLDVLASMQATGCDDYRDAQPGKIPHELRRGELAHFKLIPHTPYYGTADATPLYLVALHEAWRWSGDQVLTQGRLEAAQKCLDWIDRYGDLDGDGFQEYATRSAAGYENQGWKDSGEALVYPDGSLVKGPKALCELQGYVYDAWLRTAEIDEHLGNAKRAAELRRKAAKLFAQFNETFWDEESEYYAFALDGDKRPVLSVASNPGQCLWSGLVPPQRARAVVARLMRSDMWSGWGIRTLSAEHAAYNPYSYQKGAVWPHDNAFIARGFRRYGYVDEANLITRGVVEACDYFVLNRVPELYAGLHKDDAGFPVQYLGANVPQAWAGGSIFLFLSTMLGIRPDARTGMLYVDPVLPPWLKELTIRNLRTGGQVFDIRFQRCENETQFEILKGDADCLARRAIEWRDVL
jgi:glycogen debranching enzyme